MKRYIDADLADRLLTDGYGIDEIPSSDVAPVVHAHWIEMPNYGYTIVPYKCSVCEYRFVYRSKFCPDCGAKMDGKENENA